MRTATSEGMAHAAVRLDSIFGTISDIASMMARDPVIISYLREGESANEGGRSGGLSEYIEITSTLANYCSYNDYISYVYIWPNGDYKNDSSKLIHYSRYHPMASSLSEEARGIIARATAANKRSSVYQVLDSDSGGIFVARTVYTIDNYNFSYHGSLVLRVNMQRILRDISNSSFNAEPATILLASQQGVLYSAGPLPKGVEDSVLSIRREQMIADLDGKSYLVQERDMPKLGLRYFYMINFAGYKTLLNTQRIMVACISALAIFLVYASKRSLDSITTHFGTLNHKMQVYSSGRLEPIDVGYDYTRRNDELGAAHVQLDSMAEQIRNLINDNYVKQLLIKEAQFKQLENQINPHFLYNTLETINWYSESAGEERIARLVQALGHTLRGTLERSDMVTIKTELEIVESYMTIQGIRFESRLAFHRRIDESLMGCQIPKMTIQPIVENAIKYAMEETADMCEIFLSIKEEKGDILIAVKNTGSEFDEALNKKIHADGAPENIGIGLRNIHERMQIAYGQKYGLAVTNEAGMAVVRVSMPRIEMERDNANA
ncbi:MAG: sensor histidine kinase [Christensenellales bacterium]